MRNLNHAARTSLAPLFLMLLTHCGSGDAGTDNVESTSEDIVNGTSIAVNSLGVVALYQNGRMECSGVEMPNSEWILTARHCVIGSDGNFLPLSTFWITNVVSPGQTEPNPSTLPAASYANVTALRVYAANVDFAVARLSHKLSGTTATGLGDGPSALVNKIVECDGYGRNAPQTGAYGTLLGSSLQITSTLVYPTSPTVGEIVLAKNASGQIVINGDSGGPCFEPTSGGAKIISINSTVNNESAPTQGSSVAVGAGTPWNPWIQTTAASRFLATASNGPSGYGRSDEVNSVVRRHSSNHIHELYLDSAGWHWGDLTAITGAPNAAGPASGYRRSDGTNSVLYRGSDGHIRELYLDGAGWHWGDVTSITGAPVAAGDPAAYVRSDGTNSVLYRGSDNHIRELYLDGAGWHWGDLTSITGAPVAAGDPAAYVRSDGVNSVVYRGSDGHIRELYLDGAGWHWGDLTLITGSVVAAGNPAGYARADRVNAVVFRSSDGHIRELSLDSAGWHWGDLTSVTGAPATAVGDPFAYVRSDGVNSVVFRTSDGHIHDDYLDSAGWHTWDVTGTIGGALAVADPAAYMRTDGVNSVIYQSSDGHIRELYLDSGGWHAGDLTAASGE
ncbi:MAG TPA: trypsin-like serine protease [Polyangiaceae bacterium]|nr:trypsin-like serine protease [Polyangiaceae bacterium]